MARRATPSPWRVVSMKRAVLKATAVRTLAPLLVLALAVVALYGSFLSSPLVFDDYSYFGAHMADELRLMSGFGLRWLSISSFGWTRAVLGEDIVWQRLGNLLLHMTNAALLYLFLLRLFNATLPAEPAAAQSPSARRTLGVAWLAFFGALWFALNPAAVYGVAYLAQRTILMATLFALLTWMLFVEGLLRQQRRWLLASAGAYLLAVLSKEHAIMVPAVSGALLVLLRRPERQLWRQLGPTFLLYGVVGLFTFVQIQSGGVVGRAYEPNGMDLLAGLNIDPRQAHALSVLTQGFLYFKYLLLWIVPNPLWMSVDMMERFVPRFWSWPETAAMLAFVLYPLLAVRLLWQRARPGLLGFALLSPWLLFATELSTIRIQETFVLYRSYLWLPCLAVALPFLLHKVPARLALMILAGVTLALIPASWNRLTTLADPLLLWDDALRLAQDKGKSTRLGRMHHNRGVAHSNAKRYQEAITDFELGLRFLPSYSQLYNDRAVAYLETGRHRQALNDYNMAIWLDPTYYNPYLGRALVHEALGNPAAARLDYARSCSLGVSEVCHLGMK